MPADKHTDKEVEENVDKDEEELELVEDLSLDMPSVGAVASIAGDAIRQSSSIDCQRFRRQMHHEHPFSELPSTYALASIV